MRETHAREGKATLVLLLVVLVALVGAGAWNYQRNAAAEEQVFRPYQGYGDGDLEQLASAYRKEVETLTARYESARGGRSRVRDGGLLDQKVREFERVQRQSSSLRELSATLSQREATLAEIEAERQQRAKESDRLGLFIARVLTF